MKRIFWIFCLALLSCFGCDSDSSTAGNTEIASELQQLLESTRQDPSVKSAVMQVVSGPLHVNWKSAVGYSNPQASLKMEPDDQFFTASIGKMTLSALILKLAEENRMSLDDSIGKFLPASILSGLHVCNGTDYSSRLTVRQLLGHRSGLADFFEDGAKDANGMTPFMRKLIEEPNKNWTPEELIAYYKANFQAIAAPGTAFHYSDTGYQLLGLVVESVMQKPLAQVYWEKLFQPLSMNRTYLYLHEQPHGENGRPMSKFLFGDVILDFPSMSFDWAAGGLVTTTDDMIRFMEAIITGNYLTEASKAEMQSWTEVEKVIYYGLGITRLLYGYGPNEFIIGHEGFTNSFAMYSPKHNAYIAGTLNQGKPETVSGLYVLSGVMYILDHNR